MALLPRMSRLPAISRYIRFANILTGSHIFRRRSSSEATDLPPYNVAKLQDRGIVRVIGKDSIKFLQGLITNNMNCFVEEHCKVLATAALNVQGRLLYDLFVYLNPSEENHFLLECDMSLVPDLISHLKKYKLRSSVEILDARKEIEAWFIFQDSSSDTLSPIESFADELVALPDPRLSNFGTRVLMPWNRSPSDMIAEHNFFNVEVGFYQNYRHRYGVAEGKAEIQFGKSLPLEYNFALLNGISFSKGCYIGQELTARTHHTGVIRKRVMPIQLKEVEDLTGYPEFEPYVAVRTDSGKSAGTIITMVGGYGLGLLRVSEALSADFLVAVDVNGNETSLISSRPHWWPKALKY